MPYDPRNLRTLPQSPQPSARQAIHRRALQAAAGLARRSLRRTSVRGDASAEVSSGAALLCVCLSAAVAGCTTLPEGPSDDTLVGAEETMGSDETLGAEDEAGTSESSSEDDGEATDTSAEGESSTGTDTGDSTDSETGETGETDETSETDETGETSADSETGELEDCLLADGEVDWECCEEQDWMPFPQCTPWGPPAPPQARPLSARARLVLRGARVEELWV